MNRVKDDFKAKYSLWIKNPSAFTLPTAYDFPPFGHKRFSNYEEMNAWKRQYRAEIARTGGVKWKN